MLGKVALTLLFILLVWGNLVAGLKAGLACPDWPLCHGKLIPPFRWDVYMEFMHRVIGAITSIFLIVFAYKRFRVYRGIAKLLPILTVLLLLIQIILGGIVVLQELPVDLTTYHFANAMIIFAATLYLNLFDGKLNKPTFSISGYKGVFFFLAVLVFTQLVLGAYVRHSGSGLACPDFPTCLGYLIPPELTGIIFNHFAHRVLAYVITFFAILLLIISYLSQPIKGERTRLYMLVGFIALQILLGAGVVYAKLHFLVTALHLSVALLILSITLYMWCRCMKESQV